MDVNVALEHHFVRTPDNKVWSQTGFDISFWERYLTIFDGVNVIARVKNIEHVDEDWKLASNDKIHYHALPNYKGMSQYFRHYREIKKSIIRALLNDNATIIRAGLQVASVTEQCCHNQKRPYGLEVTNDPYGVFSKGSIHHPLRPILQWWFTKQRQLQCKRATALSYVTENALQKRYPPAPDTFTTHYSSVELKTDAFAKTTRTYSQGKKSFHLITVGSLSQSHKGTDTLLDAFAHCLDMRWNLNLTIVGGGRLQTVLEQRAETLGISELVNFVGQVAAGETVRNYLDQADLFILPSRNEGLPRALIEAMARALPCIGSNIAGFPELLSKTDMVTPNDILGLSSKIKAVLSSPSTMTDMSERNLAKSYEYHSDILSKKRNVFYDYLHKMTSKWQEKL